MQIQTKITLTVHYKEWQNNAVDKASVYIVNDLGTAMVAVSAKISPFTTEREPLTMAFVISEAVKAKLELYRHLLSCDIKHQLERLQVFHRERPPTNDQVIPLHLV
ncbi:hypothetical protein [Pseudomonas sp. 20S_6.2_Bac1]|uniref:hypothetical protein n=1 Tax=Pseudomonas sp. 20S_6.2_Bac1 TaxID=2971618 RepID=UPI0015A84AD9|nr:hypothetical protein [Pseudomonas sp. 20S_6.2_Bac1]